MPLLTQSIPNLIGGVSQQAPAIRNVNQCEEMINCFPSAIEGLVKRPPSTPLFVMRNSSDVIYTNKGQLSISPHAIYRDANEKYFCMAVPASPAGSPTDPRIEVYNLSTNQKSTVHYDTDSRLYLADSNPDGSRERFKFLTIADVTFVVNTAKTVQLAADTSTAVNYQRVALVYIKQSNTDREVEIKVTDANGNNPLTVNHKASSSQLGTDHVAEALAAAIDTQNPGAAGAYTATSSDSVIKITRGVDFKITVDDDFGGQGAILIRDEVQRFEDLPSTAPQDYIVRVIGAPESGLDDYYVKFDCVDGSGFTKGVWKETLKPEVKYKYDYATMPHILIRQSDGSFMFKRADGTTPGSNVPVGASYAAFKWSDRLVGDDSTNEAPSFVGLKIANMVLFKNRLGFLSDENIILSETSEFFNFWRTTVLDLPDSDPIDIASSSSKIGKMKSGTVFNTELILFTENSQLVLRGGDILSPKSVALLNVGDYENYSDIQPVSSGLSVFFAYDRGANFSGVREMVPQPNIDGSYVVNSTTELVPSYLSNKTLHIAATTEEDMAAFVQTGSTSLFLYKYIRNNESLLQAAWFKYEFPDLPTSAAYTKATPVWAEFIDGYMYVLLQRAFVESGAVVGYLSLEKIRIGLDQNDSTTVPTSNWVTHMDVRQYAESGSYNSTTGLTTWNLTKPYSYSAALSVVYTTNGTALPVTGGTAFNRGSDTAGTISVRGNYATTKVWIGYKYEMKYQFSQLWLQGRAGRGEAALQSGRYQLRNMSLLYEDTSFFKVKVESGGENQYEYVYSGTVVASSLLNQIYLNRGVFRVPIYGRNTSTTITLVNDTPLPCKILSAEVEADYTDRATRYA
jgi:hypothetical protein